MTLGPYFLRMIFSLAIVAVAIFFFAPDLLLIFTSNPRLNSLIIALTLGGVGYALYQLLRLRKDARTLARLKEGRWGTSSQEPTLFLEPILFLVSQKQTVVDPLFAKRLIESLADRLDNERVFPRYLVGLLVFLGLLGTFWGLSQTIASIAQLIQSMPENVSNSATFFSLLKQNLQTPLAGMGTAFSSSLFGLGGSLLIGFLELQVGHAYARFLNETDLYLATYSHQSGLTAGTTSSSAPLNYIQALLSRNVEVVDHLTQLVEKSAKNERHLAGLMDKLVTSLTFLVEQNKSHQALMTRVIDTAGLDGESRAHLKNIDLALVQSLHHHREDREEFLKRLTDELRLIARTLGSISDQPQPVR